MRKRTFRHSSDENGGCNSLLKYGRALIDFIISAFIMHSCYMLRSSDESTTGKKLFLREESSPTLNFSLC